MSDGWDVADAWVLGAVGGYRRPCSLVDLVAAADWINHAILLEDELERALGRLAGAGLLRVFEEWTFELTDEGAQLWAGEHRDLQAQLKETQAQLANFEPGRTVVTLPRGALRAAIEEYQSR